MRLSYVSCYWLAMIVLLAIADVLFLQKIMQVSMLTFYVLLCLAGVAVLIGYAHARYRESDFYAVVSAFVYMFFSFAVSLYTLPSLATATVIVEVFGYALTLALLVVAAKKLCEIKR